MTEHPPADPPRTSVGLQPRLAGAIALGAGAAAAIAGAVAAPDAPWWLPVLLFVLAGTIAWRLLRPQPRRIGWEDEV